MKWSLKHHQKVESVSSLCGFWVINVLGLRWSRLMVSLFLYSLLVFFCSTHIFLKPFLRHQTEQLMTYHHWACVLMGAFSKNKSVRVDSTSFENGGEWAFFFSSKKWKCVDITWKTLEHRACMRKMPKVKHGANAKENISEDPTEPTMRQGWKRRGMCRSMCLSVGIWRNGRTRLRKNCREFEGLWVIDEVSKCVCVCVCLGEQSACSGMDKHPHHWSMPESIRPLPKLPTFHNLMRTTLTPHACWWRSLPVWELCIWWVTNQRLITAQWSDESLSKLGPAIPAWEALHQSTNL